MAIFFFCIDKLFLNFNSFKFISFFKLKFCMDPHPIFIMIENEKVTSWSLKKEKGYNVQLLS